MAPPSPRRSSRARPSNSQSQQSSSSSVSSSRVERTTRSLNKTPSGKSTPSASLSSEPLEDLDDSHLLRRRKRGQDEDRFKVSRRDSIEMGNSDEIQEDDEAVRCICGFDEYPGPPPLENAPKQSKESKEDDIYSAIDVSDDISGFFVQCDICKVWQHGACVGIMTEQSSPDEYFCEKCRKDLHKIHVASNGQRYSSYLPLSRYSRTTSRATSLVKDGTRSPKVESTKEGRSLSAGNHHSKRRSTMNSRDAAYDEEEQLRRAIEASKEQKTAEPAESNGQRRPKRGRSDSEENVSNVKRRRTASRSVSPAPNEKSPPEHDESDDGAVTRNGFKKSRSSRATREKSEREEGEHERLRQDAANLRKGRPDRRRGEGTTAASNDRESDNLMDMDSDPSEEIPLASRTIGNKIAEVQETTEPTPVSAPPDTPPNSNILNSAAKKSGKTHKKTKGRNQYTKDRDIEFESPGRSMSRDLQRNEEAGHSASRNTTSDPHKSHAKTKTTMAHSRISLAEMKRRAGAFLEFISKTQIELAAESSGGSIRNDDDSVRDDETCGSDAPPAQTDGDAKSTPDTHRSPNSDRDSKDFKDLDCIEMMDVLTRDLLKWQGQYI